MATHTRANLIATGYGEWAGHVLRGALEDVAQLTFSDEEVVQLVASWLSTPQLTGSTETAGLRSVVVPVGDAPDEGDVLTRQGEEWVAAPAGSVFTSTPGYRGAWAPSTAYKARELAMAPSSAPAKLRGRLVSANADFTSTGSFVAANWALAEHDENFQGVFATTTAYLAGQVVSYLGQLYSANADFTSGGSFLLSDWTSLSTQVAATVTVTPTGSLTGTNAQAALEALAVRELAVESSSVGKLDRSLVDAKGDLLVGTANDVVARLAAGSLGRYLASDSSQAAGLKWVDAKVFDARDYGATYDGSTDDSAAINAAIVAASAVGGIVELRATGGLAVGSRIKINSDIVVRDQVWLRGLGPGTTFTGAGRIRIPNATEGIPFADRIMISDFFMQSPLGSAGIFLDNNGSTGGLQLGWPRITVQNVTITDATGYGFQIVLGSVFECRLINCVAIRGATTSFLINSTDNFLWGCTAGGSASGGGNPGFNIAGGNNKLTLCKSYGQSGDGFSVGSRHMLTACEAQDCARGFVLSGEWNTLAGCLSDTSSVCSYEIQADNNIVNGAAMYGGGGTGAVTRVGVYFSGTAKGNVVDLTSNATLKAGGSLEGNTVRLGGQTGKQTVTYAATITPDLYLGGTIAVTLTGNPTIKSPLLSLPGQRMAFLLSQDATGGRTVTFESSYRTAANWAPSKAPSTTDRIEFEYDGARWVQSGVSIGLTNRATIVEPFTYADGALPAPWVTSDAKCVIASNKLVAPTASAFSTSSHAWRDAGTPDATVQATMLDDKGLLTWRVVDATNFYVWGPNFVYRVTAGTPVQLSSGSLSYVANDVLKVVCSGGSFKLYKNGTFIKALADSSFLTATKFGVGIQHPSSLGVDDFALDGDSAAASTNPPSGTVQGYNLNPPVPVGAWLAHAATTEGTFAFTNGDLRLGALWLPDGWELDGLACEITVVGTAGAKCRAVLFKDDGNGKPGALVLDGGQVDGTVVVSGGTIVTGLASGKITSPRGLYWAGAVNQGAAATPPTLRYVTVGPLQRAFTTLALQNMAPAHWLLTGVTGAPPTTGAAAVLSPSGGGYPAVAVRRSA